MPLSVAVQMDPIETINPLGDSSFALMLEAQARGHSLSYYTPDTLAQRGNTVTARVHKISVDDIAARFGLKRKQVYDAALRIKAGT